MWGIILPRNQRLCCLCHEQEWKTKNQRINAWTGSEDKDAEKGSEEWDPEKGRTSQRKYENQKLTRIWKQEYQQIVYSQEEKKQKF